MQEHSIGLTVGTISTMVLEYVVVKLVVSVAVVTCSPSQKYLWRS